MAREFCFWASLLLAVPFGEKPVLQDYQQREPQMIVEQLVSSELT